VNSKNRAIKIAMNTNNNTTKLEVNRVMYSGEGAQRKSTLDTS
jgi:hypothetical protein